MPNINTHYGSAAHGKFAIRQPKEELVYEPLEYDRGSQFYRIVGEKQYHLTDHLGNVRATVSDIKEPTGASFTTNTITAASFYPFVERSEIPTAFQFHKTIGRFMEEGRFFFGGSNRWGFNGMEKDDEIKGAGNSLTTEFRMNDPRIGGRWWSLDPKPNPSISRYAGYENNPVFYSDPRGDTVIGDQKGIQKYKNEIQNGKTSTWNKMLNPNLSVNKRKQLNTQFGEYLDMETEFKVLENSTQNYYLETSAKISSSGLLTYDKKRKYVMVKVASQVNRSGFFSFAAHEFKHAYQFETLQLDLRYDGLSTNNSLYDLWDEVEAYTRQAILAGTSTSHITPKWVESLKDKNGFQPYFGLSSVKTDFNTLIKNPVDPSVITIGDDLKFQIYLRGASKQLPKVIFKGWEKYYEMGKKGKPYTP